MAHIYSKPKLVPKQATELKRFFLQQSNSQSYTRATCEHRSNGQSHARATSEHPSRDQSYTRATGDRQVLNKATPEQQVSATLYPEVHQSKRGAANISEHKVVPRGTPEQQGGTKY